MRHTWVLGLGMLAICACTHSPGLQPPWSRCNPDCEKLEASNTSVRPTMGSIARDVDRLERLIECNGSVVARAPSVWGQARLTRYRADFEQEMARDYPNFKLGLQGSLARADSAFFASALSIGLAAKPPKAASTASAPAAPPALVPTEKTVETTSKSTSPSESTETKTSTKYGTPPPPPAPATPKPIEIPSTLPTDFLAVGGTNARLPKELLGFDEFKDQIGIEMTAYLAQKQRYLNYLDQIRRTNEGDDTADSPGYALNLVRIPVSVLPGSKTDVGHGAEITFTLNSVLSDELLPTTFRNLVVNDLADQFAFPITALLNNKEFVKTLAQATDEGEAKVEAKVEADTGEGKGQKTVVGTKLLPQKGQPNQYRQMLLNAGVQSAPRTFTPSKQAARSSFPVSQIGDLYGDLEMTNVAYFANRSFKADTATRGFIHLPDVKSFLSREVASAMKLLDSQAGQILWTQYCRPELAEAIDSQNLTVVESRRKEFRTAIANVTQTPEAQYSLSAALAWAIIVDATRLTHQLAHDMKEVSAAKGVSLPSSWQDYYLPEPSSAARHAFNEYVKARWPIRVFALDPEEQTQNIADSFSARREMQLALSVAFASGRLSAKNLTRFARRLELEAEAVGFNRTQVGFSHGENTFGWRFYPRFQTPDTESNATVLFRDMLVGGPNRNALLAQRRLEPGPRECVAIVMMPSFVPNATLDSASTWFRLTSPKAKTQDSADAIALGRAARTIRDRACLVKDATCYRDGDYGRLLRRVDQLEARLPLQTLSVQVPYENTLGGFEMFSVGITDLAPDLIGWYGAPGIDLDSFTTLFLVGDRFSVLETRVIAGNRAAAHKLLSRQVMQVVIPPGAIPRKDGQVEIHLATPYGVSRTLVVPVHKAAPAAAPKEGYSLDPQKIVVRYQTCPMADKVYFKYVGVKPVDGVIAVKFADSSGSVPDKINVTFNFDDPRVSCGTELTAVDGKFVIDNKKLVLLSASLVDEVNRWGPHPAGATPLATPFVTKSILITPSSDNHATQPVEALSKFTFEFEEVRRKAGELCDPPVAPPQPPEIPPDLPQATNGVILPAPAAPRVEATPMPQLPLPPIVPLPDVK